MNLSTKILAFFLSAAIVQSLPQRQQKQQKKIRISNKPNENIPKAIINYHDKLMAFPGHVKYGQNFNLINQTLAQDWNERPNLINPGYGIQTGPFPRGKQQMYQTYSKIFKHIRVQRNATYVIGDVVVVLTRFKATMGDVPPGYPGYPMFPGIEPKKLKGKSFETMKMHVHYMDNEWDGQQWVKKIRRTYHFVDWTLALDEMLSDRRPFKFHQPYLKPARNLTEVPQAVYDFYNNILSDVSGKGQNVQMLEQTVHKDWSSRPNYINLVDGKGPNLNGLKSLIGLFNKIIPNLKFEMRRVWIHHDKVIVLSQVTGKVTGTPMGSNEIPLFPGIRADKIMNKEFTTVALDIHKIVDGKIKQTYHIEDWKTALEQMLYNKKAPCFGLYPDFTNFHVPKPIHKFYDHILSNPGTYGQNMTFINETFAEDWNTRPNPFSFKGNNFKGVRAGPFGEGLKKMLGFWNFMFKDIKYKRLHTIKMGNKVAVINWVEGTMGEPNAPQTEFPMFPGIPAEKLKGKNFSTLAMDLNILDDEEHHDDQFNHQNERIRRSWHFEDWSEAATQMLQNRGPAKLNHPWHQRGKNLTSVPRSIYNFYDKIWSNPTEASINITLLNETVCEEWTVRPNPIDPEEGKGPGLYGLQKITEVFGQIIPDMKSERTETFLHEDMVIVLLKVSGTIKESTVYKDSIPMFPGIKPSDLFGKKFETVAMEVHRIFDGKIQQTYQNIDWRSVLYQLLKDRPVPDFGFNHEYISFERFNLTEHAHRVPRAIENFYDRINNNYLDGQNQTLINQTFAEDFNMRPNPLNPQRGIQAGPLRSGLKDLFSLNQVMMRNMNVTRMYTAQLGNVILVLSNVTATMNHIPPGLPEFPIFPGIPEHKLRNKIFNTLSMDLHVLDDNAQIKRSWLFTDHSLALDQMLTGRHNPDLIHPYIPRGRVLEEVPQSIYNWYEKILNNFPVFGEDDELFKETFAEDYASLPREGHHDEIVHGVAPGIEGVKSYVQWANKAISDIRFERKATLLYEDAVIVLTKVSGTVQGNGDTAFRGRPENEIIFFPGIPAEKLEGKRFETMFLEVHCIRDGKIKQTYRVEDWSTALRQMLYGHPAPDFGFDRSFIEF